DLSAPDAAGADYNHRRRAEALAQSLPPPPRPGAAAMNVDQKLTAIRDLIQQDVGNRGLAREPHDNLLTATRDDFAAACRSFVAEPHPALDITTGFFIPTGTPPAYETDGPLGAAFIMRALVPLGYQLGIGSRRSVTTAIAAAMSTVTGFSTEHIPLIG